jgi:hypothetical protein
MPKLNSWVKAIIVSMVAIAIVFRVRQVRDIVVGPGA